LQPWLKTVMMVAVLGAPILAVIVYGVIKAGSSDSSRSMAQYQEVDWQKLRELNLETGDAPATLAALDGQKVRIPGFIVPLDDDAESFSEFLLVPSPQACIHVPPPPANQMVLVRMEAGKAPERSWRPVWLLGRLQITVTESFYGNTSYRLYGEGWEPYQM